MCGWVCHGRCRKKRCLRYSAHFCTAQCRQKWLEESTDEEAPNKGEGPPRVIYDAWKYLQWPHVNTYQYVICAEEESWEVDEPAEAVVMPEVNGGRPQWPDFREFVEDNASRFRLLSSDSPQREMSKEAFTWQWPVCCMCYDPVKHGSLRRDSFFPTK